MTGSNFQLDLAESYVQLTGKNIFLTGKAGTGKTTFLKEIRKKSSKRMIVVAPTGVAAINAGGVTIHSFFQLAFGPIVPGQQGSGQSGKKPFDKIRRFSKEKIRIMKSLDLLIIDEISMVRADLLDGIDETLRRFKDRNKVFGGVQLLMIGDLQQLAPVVKNEEWEILRDYYDSAFFFSSRALKKTDYITILLKKIYRQSDQAFIDILNKVRTNTADSETLKTLNERYIPGYIDQNHDGYIILATHNHQAASINKKRLDELKNPSVILSGDSEGDFPEYSFPTDIHLELKVDAQVMFIKNDPSPDKEYFNGKIGVISEIEEDEIWIRCEGEDNLISLGKHEWENVKYHIDEETAEIKEEIVGRFIQFPLKLAWAITIHKSQGLTFEKTIIDARSAFAHGQVYVALSRCKSLEGLVLNAPLRIESFITNEKVAGFTRSAEENHPDEQSLSEARRKYERELIEELFDFSNIAQSLSGLLYKSRNFKGSLTEDISIQLENISKMANKDIFTVSDTFYRQIQGLNNKQVDLKQNPALNERILKASNYFSGKIKLIIQEIPGIHFETDNKEIRKQLDKKKVELEELLSIKLLCLEGCSTGFSVDKYLDIRAKSELEPEIKREKAGKPFPDTSDKLNHPDIYAELIKWRNHVSKSLKVPPYRVAHIKTLKNIANHLPVNLSDLGKIKGMGKKGIEKYGAEILRIVTDRSGHAIQLNSTEEGGMPVPKNKKPEKIHTSEISFGLFRQGKSVKEIAMERNLTTGTIETHLSKKIASGELDILELMDKNKVNRLLSHFRSSGEGSFSETKELFKDEFSYGEIRFVFSYKEFLDKKNIQERSS